MKKDTWETQTWDTESPDFSVDDPIGRLASLKPFEKTEDKKGHGVFLSAWFPKEYARRVSVIKEAGSFTYTTTSDVVRDAIFLGLIVLELRLASDPEWQLYTQLEILNNTAKWESELYGQEDAFCESLATFMENKEEGHATELLQARFALLHRNGCAKRKEALLDAIRKHRLTQLLEKCKVV